MTNRELAEIVVVASVISVALVIFMFWVYLTLGVI